MKQVLFLTLLLTSLLSKGQTRTVIGRVLYDDLSPVYKAIILGHDTIQLGSSGLNGDFTIELPTSDDDLKIAMIGMEIAWLKVPQDCSRVEIVMIPDGTYDYKSHKKIDRMRESMFNKIPELHASAFDKGLFTTSAPCYTREFKSDKPYLDEIRGELKAEQKRIKSLFRKLQIGDTIQVPFTETYGSDGTNRTTLTPWAYFTDETRARCLIEGIVTRKDRRNSGYNVEVKVTNCELCKHDTPITYREREIVIGTVFIHNMKVLKLVAK